MAIFESEPDCPKGCPDRFDKPVGELKADCANDGDDR